jgi:prepilin-type N-terminal cleavage/methylation domain-containing protein
MRRLRGFTLLELMMAIVILAVLAVVASASYIRYMRRARTQEAIALLGDIRIRQELFYQSNSRYACSDENCGCGPGAFFPSNPDPTDPSNDLPVTAPYQACASATTYPQLAWCQLGLDPNGEYYFKYAFVGWDGQTTTKNDCDGITTCNGPNQANCFALDTTRPWWFAVAHANLDRDPHVTMSTYYLSSALKSVVMFNDIE